MRILIAEDDLTSRMILVEVLKKHGYQVVATQNGAEAWRALQGPEAPRLLILDWVMPEMDGVELCRRIRAGAADRPLHIILLTAKGGVDDIRAGFEAGADDYLVKPFNTGELLARVNVGRRMIELHTALLEKNAALDQAVAQLRKFGAELTQIEDRERKRLAMWLHDDLQQCLVAATIKVSTINLEQSKAEQAEAVREAIDLLENTLRRSRAMTTDLYPPILLDGGLVPSLNWLKERMDELYGLKVAVTADESLTVPESLTTLVFHVVRELLFNVVKHAGVKKARIEVTPDEGLLRVVVEDRGAGFVPGAMLAASSHSGFGLLDLRERLSYAGGSLEVASSPGQGTRVSFAIPV